MLAFLLLTNALLGTAKMFVAVYAVSGVEWNSKRWKWVMIGCIYGFYAIALLVFSLIAEVEVLHSFDAFVLPVLQLLPAVLLLKSRRQLPRLIGIYLLLVLVDLLIMTAYVALAKGEYVDIYRHTEVIMIVQLCGLTLLGALGWLIRKKRPAMTVLYDDNAPQRVFSVITIGTLGLLIYISPIQFILSMHNQQAQLMGLIGVSISCAVFFVLCLIGLISTVRKERYKNENQTYQLLLENQRKHYRDLIDRETEIRALQHDMSAKLYGMLGLLSEGQTEALEENIRDMLEVVDAPCSVHTGNDVLDVVVNQLVAEKEDMQIAWKGRMPDDSKIAPIDLCVVFSNLLNNAIRAVKQCKQTTIAVEVRRMTHALYISIKNPVMAPVKLISGRPQTDRGDSGAHGYGLRNVEGVVSKYGGSIEYVNNNGEFAVEIVLEDSAA